MNNSSTLFSEKKRRKAEGMLRRSSYPSNADFISGSQTARVECGQPSRKAVKTTLRTKLTSL